MTELALLKRMTDILKAPVKNKDGEEFGTVRDFLVGAEGRIRYAILAHGGFLRVRDRLIPVPFEAFAWNAERRFFILDMDRNTLEMAPNCDPGKLPPYSESGWGERIEAYFDNVMVRMGSGQPEREGPRVTH